MNFCKKCNNLLELSKTVKNYSSNFIDNIITKFVNNTLDNTDLVNINLDQIIKNDKYLELSEELKNKLLNILNKNSELYGAYNICSNCGYYEKIKNKTLILTRDELYNDTIIDIYMDNYKFVKHDKTLPHTRKYICPNDKCKTHNDDKIKDAVSFRIDDKLFLTYYICCICDIVWKF